MLPSSPGPSSTVSGRPVSVTGSPGRTPEVSSYTWIVVLSPVIRITSPMSCSEPTSTTSYMRGRRPTAVTTGPATGTIAPLAFAFMSARIATAPTSLEQVHANRPSDLRPEVLGLRRADRDHDRSRDGLQPSPHRVAQLLHVARLEDEDPDVGLVEDLGDPPLEVLRRRGDRLAHPDELEPLDEVVPADRGEFHFTSP